jgi:phage I-like protein
LSLAANTLSISGNAKTVDLAKYLDNTDNQDLTLSGNTLSLTNDATSIDLSKYADNTDNQELSLATNTLSISGNAKTVDLAKYLDNTDNQDLTLSGNTLSLTNDATSIDLSKYADNTDNQELSLATNTLSISGNAKTVDLAKYLDNTDNQNLTSASLSGTELTISIENGKSVSVNLAPLVTKLQSDLTAAQDRVTSLETQMAAILSRVKALENCACNGTLSNDNSVTTRKREATLYQNIPNPFGSNSSIKYYLPYETASAYMIFTDSAGKVVSKIKLEDRGEASLDINADGLASGMYMYTLIIGNKQIATKRMLIK